MLLPPIESLFPPADRIGRIGFWAWYLGAMVVTSPLATAWQFAQVLKQTRDLLRTRSKIFWFLDHKLAVKYLASGRLAQASSVFGEQFVVIKYRDVLIDTGPPRSRETLKRFLLSLPPGSVSKLLCTHFHEEHIGNAVTIARTLNVPIYGTRRTLEEIRSPTRLPFYRRLYIGQPTSPDGPVDLQELSDAVGIENGELRVIVSPGHCEGHVSFYCPENKILFAGDSYMLDEMTFPNRDVSATEWIATLQQYTRLEIDTLIEGHGLIYTRDPRFPDVPGVVVRRDPQKIIRDKLDFLLWAKKAVTYAEELGIDYRLVEACLFPPTRLRSWGTWVRDESYRFYSWGEFSRTQFIRSLAKDPQAVPPRNPVNHAFITWLNRRLDKL